MPELERGVPGFIKSLHNLIRFWSKYRLVVTAFLVIWNPAEAGNVTHFLDSLAAFLPTIEAMVPIPRPD